MMTMVICDSSPVTLHRGDGMGTNNNCLQRSSNAAAQSQRRNSTVTSEETAAETAAAETAAKSCEGGKQRQQRLKGVGNKKKRRRHIYDHHHITTTTTCPKTDRLAPDPSLSDLVLANHSSWGWPQQDCLSGQPQHFQARERAVAREDKDR